MTGFWVTFGISFYVIIMVGGSFTALGLIWNKIATEYPAVTPEENAISRSFQSCSIGIFNLGLSVRITVDTEYLHLAPNLFVLCATRRKMSIPWDDIKLIGYHFFKRYRVFNVRKFKWKFVAPIWAMDLAAPTEPAEANDDT